MLYRLALLTVVATVLISLNACDSTSSRSGGNSTGGPAGSVAPGPIGDPLYEGIDSPEPAKQLPVGGKLAVDPIVVANCQLVAIEKPDVPSQRDGIILFFGAELKPKEDPPPGRKLIVYQIGNEQFRFRSLMENDPVEKDQVLAQLDDRLARDEWGIQEAKIEASQADLEATIKTRDEAKSRYDRARDLYTKKAMALEEVNGAKLTWDRYSYESISKREAVKVAKQEKNKAVTLLDMHRIRSPINGVIKMAYKKPGEAVKAYEPVFQVQNIDKLRVEGYLDQHAYLRLGKRYRIVVEPSQPEGPTQTLVGHLQEVNAVAVSNRAKDPLIVSGSDDGTIRVWSRTDTREVKLPLRHASGPGVVPVRAVACTPPGVPNHWFISGGGDGKAYIWDLDSESDQPLRALNGVHKGGILAVAFAPDGATCATAGNDREICLWDTATGELRYRFPAGHLGPVTSLQFTPRVQLISAGRDNTVRVWSLGNQGAKLETTFDRRSGDVSAMGASPDGRRILFDQGKTLRLLSVTGGRTEGELKNPSGGANFTTFAQFSPNGQLIVTSAGTSEERLQLWRAPSAANQRAYELRQLVSPERAPATCAAFAPDGSFLVTGSRDKQVLVWAVPDRKAIEQELVGNELRVDRAVESDRKVRVWTEVDNPTHILLPNGTATMVIYPSE